MSAPTDSIKTFLLFCRGRPPDVPSVVNDTRAVEDAGPYNEKMTPDGVIFYTNVGLRKPKLTAMAASTFSITAPST